MTKSRILRSIGLGLLVVLIAGGVWGYRQVAPFARIGSTYIAKQYCSCVFVAGRSDASCRSDFEPDIDKFSITADRSALPARGKVTARLAMFAGEATYADGFGCTVAK